MRSTRILASAALAFSLVPAERALAVEGGTGAYLLGSRDTMAGIVPPPGTYMTTDFIHFEGSVNDVSIGGLPVVSADVSTNLFKLGITQSYATQIWGGTPAININIPLASADLTFTGPFGNGIQDHQSGMGDVTVTPMLGWHQGDLHWNAFVSVYVPVGQYSATTVDLAAREIDALSIGKDVWSMQPGVAMTWFTPKTGFELSGALSVLFSQFHDATDYQTAPQVMLEMSALQHFKSGLAVGLTGYAYQQVGDDSGAGADAIRAALGADSLQASVNGIGPIMTYQGKLFGNATSFEAKHVSEFDATRRFGSDIVWLSATISF